MVTARTIPRAIAGLSALLLAQVLFMSPAHAADMPPQEAKEISVEAYIYLYPLVTMDVTRRLMSNVPAGKKPGAGPANQFQHLRTFPAADFREVVRPNFDTLYSPAWLDLRKEPMIVSIPDSQDRYYVFPIYDMWTDIFFAPGKRTTGTGAQHYAVVPPGWSGQVPAGVERVQSPTRMNWIIVRTQTNGVRDYDSVHKFQDGMQITPLSQWGKGQVKLPAFKADPSVDMKTEPLKQVNNMAGDAYFAYAAELMKLHAPHLSDGSTVARMKQIGIVPGKSFDASKASPVVREAIKAAPAAAMQVMQQRIPTVARVVNGWQMNTDTMGVWGNYYLKRAIFTLVGLGANHAEDAIYPLAVVDADGKKLMGENSYVLHFGKDQIPPAGAFWSVTMYDAEGFQVANSLNRFAIGDRDALKFDADGSLTLYIQHASPGAQKESNWLPSPSSGELGITMRIYAPKPEALDGRWAPPAIRNAQSAKAAGLGEGTRTDEAFARSAQAAKAE